jgi:hypothetical protein
MLSKIANFYTGIQHYVTAGLGILCIVLSLGWYTTHLKLEAETSGRQADKSRYEAVQAKTELDFKNYKTDKEKESRDKAAKADADAAALSDKYHAAVLRYQAAQRKTSGPSTVPSEGNTTESLDGPGESSLISITTEDALICADNTARLEIGHDWAIDLEK